MTIALAMVFGIFGLLALAWAIAEFLNDERSVFSGAAPIATMGAMLGSQGRCETTLTERFENPECRCNTYEGNFGPCETFEIGANGNCVYCDHSSACHKEITA